MWPIGRQGEQGCRWLVEHQSASRVAGDVEKKAIPRQGREACRTVREGGVEQGALDRRSTAFAQTRFARFCLPADWPVFIRFLSICLTAPALLRINARRPYFTFVARLFHGKKCTGESGYVVVKFFDNDIC